MAVLWRDFRMAERVTFDGQRQKAALAAFQKRAGLDATTAAQAVGLSYPQYNRYLWGRLPLRTDQIPAFAAAYGVTTAELTLALGLMDEPADQPWSMAGALRGQVPQDLADEWVERAERLGMSIEAQQAIATELIRETRQVVRERTDEWLAQQQQRRCNRPA